MTKSIILSLSCAALLGVTACTDPSQPNNNQKTQDGAVTGAVIGTIIGVAVGDDPGSKRRGAVLGAALGAGIGGAIGRQLDQQAEELERDLDGRVRVVNTGNELIVTMPQDILFAVDSADVRGDLRDDLRALASSLNRYPDTTVDIIGHTDNTGQAGYNQRLSAQRARAVAGILVGAGVDSFRLRAIGRGEDNPIATNQTAAGRQANRRVEIIIRPNT